ncbi:MAG TPA: type II CAAX endopeptidase family protein [Candidatus Dormibacteraeota bacterium]|nr:type II CAAX endopeptidase family protein [Candidatus Dormibacteraeota bacterium]
MTSHDSPTSSPEAFAPAPSFGLLLASLLSGFAAAILTGFAMGVRLHHLLAWQVNVVQLGFYVGLGSVLIPLLPRVARRSLRSLGLAPPRLRQILWGILGVPVMLVVTSIIGGVITAFFGEHEQAALRMLPRFDTPGLLLGFALIAAVAAPFFEELFFRGFIFNALAARWPFWPAALVSGLIFGVVHGDVWALLPLWGVGVLLAYVYHRTRSLWASMVAHGLFNSVSLVAVSLKDHLHL